MKVKIPDLGTYDLRNFDYYVTETEMYLINKQTSGFIINNKKEKTKLPKRHHTWVIYNHKKITSTPTKNLTIEV